MTTQDTYSKIPFNSFAPFLYLASLLAAPSKITDDIVIERKICSLFININYSKTHQQNIILQYFFILKK